MHYSLKNLPVAAAIASALTIPASAQYCSANQSVATTKYPNKCQIAQVFNYPGQVNSTAFFAQVVAPDVHWTLMGTHPLAGEYHNKTIFLTDTLERLENTLVTGTATLNLVHIIGGGDEEWSVQELHGTGICKNGKYLLPCSSSSTGHFPYEAWKGTLNRQNKALTSPV